MSYASICLITAILALPALAARDRVPRRLIDGSSAPAVPKPLRGQDPTFVMTRARVTPTTAARRRVIACAVGERVIGKIVERLGVNGRTLTFRKPDSGIQGCDRYPKARLIQAPWCGGAAWVLRDGRVSDPRLDLCYDTRGRALIAFGWINPVPHARWIVVDQPGYREVYPVAGHLPVRVSTVSGLGRAGGAVFHTTQYDKHGVLLVRRKVVAAIAS
jgi:hypothetical protein